MFFKFCFELSIGLSGVEKYYY